MSNKLWKKVWENNQIDFHQSHTNSLLQDYWSVLALPFDAHVFVPLCGKSRDIQWLLSQNCHVMGVELSAIAVAAFFAENQLIPHKTRHGKLIRWQCDKITIYCGDFFDLKQQDLLGIVAVYDRAALLALSPAVRKRYVRHMHHILPQACPTLLLTTEYPDEHAVDTHWVIDTEITALYETAYSIELLHGEQGFETHPGYGHSVTERTEEKVYLLRAH